ncbi:unnamed protein product [Prorocentrum cordatum]|uniref:EF-hand domain-containing protein n=1 Tax=Prorocentrum cordatum TaxID=2364126 RepID=A0ABN9PHV3_9DINO|nr:unnamed protein product [Polarella glacialis]
MPPPSAPAPAAHCAAPWPKAAPKVAGPGPLAPGPLRPPAEERGGPEPAGCPCPAAAEGIVVPPPSREKVDQEAPEQVDEQSRRDHFEAAVHVVQHEIGSANEIRDRLGKLESSRTDEGLEVLMTFAGRLEQLKLAVQVMREAEVDMRQVGPAGTIRVTSLVDVCRALKNSSDRLEAEVEKRRIKVLELERYRKRQEAQARLDRLLAEVAEATQGAEGRLALYRFLEAESAWPDKGAALEAAEHALEECASAAEVLASKSCEMGESVEAQKMKRSPEYSLLKTKADRQHQEAQGIVKRARAARDRADEAHRAAETVDLVEAAETSVTRVREVVRLLADAASLDSEQLAGELFVVQRAVDEASASVGSAEAAVNAHPPDNLKKRVAISRSLMDSKSALRTLEREVCQARALAGQKAATEQQDAQQRSLFDAFDSNGDGFLSRRRAPRGAAALPRAGGAPGHRGDSAVTGTSEPGWRTVREL